MTKQNKKIIILFSILLLVVGGFLGYVKLAYAQPDLGIAPVGNTIGLPSTDIRLVVARIIRTALGLLGIVALVLILYGGFVWMTAGGDDERISQAKKILLNSVIGLAIIMSSYAIASFVIKGLVGATTNNNNNNSVSDGSPSVGIAGIGNPYFPSGIFYIDSMSSGGNLCIRNVHLTITFNKKVDIDTLRGNVVVRTDSGSEQAGEWRALNDLAVMFVPNGDCGSGTADCYAPSTAYTLHFKNGNLIKTADGQMSLNCAVKAGCNDVRFVTGDGVDRLPPQIKIEPLASDLLRVGSVVPVKIFYNDDNGVQKVDLSADNQLVSSQAISGCQKTGSLSVNWPTAQITGGQHSLSATGYDWAALSGSDSTNVNLLPPHCFDNSLQADLGEVLVGPPACGGACGACAGNSCVNNVSCASGYCNTTAGICEDRMRINDVSPLSGGPGTFVSISGNYFGTIPGKVFIGGVLAPLAPCGVGAWSPWQIIAEVPVGAISGPVSVETASNTVGKKFTDATNDIFGPVISNFEVNNLARPGLCDIKPASDLPGAEVALIGQHFGIALGQVYFGQQSVPVAPVNWTDTLIRTRVPLIDSGSVGVKVTKDNLDSNSIKFFVEQGLSGTAPIISAITPDHGGKGEYITIFGNNFGNQTGRVWFKENNNGQPGDAIEGSFVFPSGCQNTWTDKQIIVKFPAGSGVVGKSYFVQVRPASAAQGTSPIGPTFNLEDVTPSPGICSINPVSGPVPFAESAPDMKIVGENFGLAPEVYFWSADASSTSITGRVAARINDVTNLTVGQSISTRPPVGAINGPVIAYRKTDNKLSNPQSFSVIDCVKNNNTCTAAGTHCCVVGAESGMCKPDGELCTGETLSAGFIWRFSTKDIPKVPQVVERCNDQTDAGQNIPSPSPNVLWDTSVTGPHHNVCRTAAVVVEFNLDTINKISRNNFLINECAADTVDEAGRTCKAVGTVAVSAPPGDLVPKLSTENNSYLELFPDASYNNGRWKDGTWYQVVLRSGITAGSGTSTAFLAKDKPCGADSAYCFVFKADSQDCKMKQVVVTPYSYRTSILEAPIKHRDFVNDEGQDVVYNGHGLSTQHCVVMNTDAFNWSWNVSNNGYANIFSTDNDSAKVSSVANTVGVGLVDPDNAVNINANASLAAANYTGHSPLIIDLNNPEVVEFWPTCLQSCTNTEVGVRFNTTMSNKNLPNGPVQLLKCNDENCINTTPVLAAADVALDDSSNYRVLKIANSGPNSAELEPDTIYKVIISASTTDFNSTELLWSASKFNDPSTHSKPYNKQFSWRFKTKKEKCKISRVDVSPQSYYAEFVNDKKIYSSQPYSSPDACSASGQKLNPWTVSWDWNSSAPLVAKVTTFNTKGNNPYCTLNCLRKGSVIALGEPPVSVCGNGVVEAGEDCDSPSKGAGCGLDCRRLGNLNNVSCGNGIIEPGLGETCDPGIPNSAKGCSNKCLHTGSAQATEATAVGDSICGNGAIGNGEDCDLGILPSVGAPLSGMNCSNVCLHQGTRLSNSWCLANKVGFGGFTETEFNIACRVAISRCGDGINSPDEDPGCDLGNNAKAAKCNEFCLINSNIVPPTECVPNNEGCDKNGQHIGSSLLYSLPSLCGDGVVGIGEDGFCETNLPVGHAGINPWSLVTGVGLGVPEGVPPSQKTDISASTNENTVAGAIGDKGSFIIACGYKTDAECQARLGDGWGVAPNGCCYTRPKLLKVYPGSTANPQANICPNTAIEATFDQDLDISSLKDNFVIARGLHAATDNVCVEGQDVSNLVASAVNNMDLPWYRKIIVAVFDFFRGLVGENAEAVRNDIISNKWCAGQDVGQADIVMASGTLSKVVFKLKRPLAFDTDYFIAIKDGLRSKKGISIGKNPATNKPLSWKFITGTKMCEVDSVNIEPAQVYFDKAGATSTLVARAYNVSGAQVQPIPEYYAWNYFWQPATNSYVNLEFTSSSLNTISAQNHNGEIDVRASAIITSNTYSAQVGSVAAGKSHVIVFLCENPWPPKDLYLDDMGPYAIFPYEDKEGNNDGYNLARDTFDNTPIPPSPSGRYFNFRSYYCADSGAFGVDDDLPYLRPAVQVSETIVSDSPTSSLKRFIFTNKKNNDAIGAAVFSNPNHLTVADWFAADRALGGQGFTGNMQTTKIDGYDALTDGNNIYVDALNINFSNAVPPVAGNLYSNIYLFSINANAQPETRKVFEQMINNLRFNTNLTNYGYCGTTMSNPGASTTCQTDLDCPATEICSVQTDKLKRNYKRLRDLKEIQDLLGL